jgi:hypothetical protein
MDDAFDAYHKKGGTKAEADFEARALANLFLQAVKWDPQESHFSSLALDCLKGFGVDDILDEIREISEDAYRGGLIA